MDWIEASTAQAHRTPPLVQDRPARSVPEPQRRETLLSAAETLFLTRGFVATTMSDVARAAGMSKKTIYQVFESKAALFTALLCSRLGEAAPSPGVEGLPPKEALTRLLQHLAGQVLAPNHIALCRLILAGGSTLPAVSAIFKEQCAEREQLLAAWLAAEADRGTFRIADRQEALEMLLAHAIGTPRWRLLADLTPAPTEADITAGIHRAIAIFMREFATPAPSVIA